MTRRAPARGFRPTSRPALLAAIYLLISAGADWIHGRSGNSNPWEFPAQLLTKGVEADPNEAPLGVLLLVLTVIAFILAYLPHKATDTASVMLGAAGLLLSAAFAMQAAYGVRILADGRDFFDVAGMGFYALVGGSAGSMLRPVHDTRAGRAISYAIISAVLLGGALLVLTADRGSSASRPTAVTTPGTSATPTTVTTPTQLGLYEVTARPCIRLRRGPSVEATSTFCMGTGELVRSDEERVTAEGYTWLHARHPRKGWGWAAIVRLSDGREYLRRIPTD